MLKAIGICVLIGWAFGVASLAGAGEMAGPYDLVVALGMGLVPAAFGSFVAYSKRKSKEFNAAYMTTAIVSALITFGSIYGALNE